MNRYRVYYSNYGTECWTEMTTEQSASELLDDLYANEVCGGDYRVVLLDYVDDSVLLIQALYLASAVGWVSTKFLQCWLRVDHKTACRLLQHLESLGFCGGGTVDEKREILVDLEEYLMSPEKIVEEITCN